MPDTAPSRTKINPPLHPASRTTWTDLLRPPPGHRFDMAVATTYSVSLEMLLALPVALMTQDAASFDALLDRERRPSLLAALHGVMAEFTVFCQESRIASAEKLPELVGLIEPSVFEARAPHPKGSFHPKVWLLRYRPADDGPGLLRLLVLSRNLTRDESWDVALALDGRIGDTTLDANMPLATFLGRLHAMATRTVPGERRSQMKSLIADARTAVWTPPPGLSRVRFYATGLGGRHQAAWMPGRSQRLMVISPFIDAPALKALAHDTGEPVALVSRADQLDRALGNGGGPFARYFTLDPNLGAAESCEGGSGPPGPRLSGLHAKIYLSERRGKLHFAIGSANATSAALQGRNVEFMAEFRADPQVFGTTVDAFFENTTAFHKLLRSYEPGNPEAEPETPADLRSLRKALGEADLVVRGVPAGQGVNLDLVARSAFDAGLFGRLRGWLATGSADDAMDVLDDLAGGRPARLNPRPIPIAAVTGFIGFGLAPADADADADAGERFMMNLPVEGIDPDARRSAILRSVLRSPEDFIRYVELLLGDPDGAGASGDGGGGAWVGVGGPSGNRMLENIVRFLARDPGRLLSVHRTVTEMRLGGEAGEAVPKQFLKLWKVVETMLHPPSVGSARRRTGR
ncbi:hypothetical protein [Azospirillum melinis]